MSTKPLGTSLLKLEKVLDTLILEHDLQWGDVLNLVHGHLVIHCPEAQEVYEEDDSSPVFYYGPRR